MGWGGVSAAGDRLVEGVMRPRADVVLLRCHMDVRAVSALVAAGPCSRHPVTGRGVDDGEGVLEVSEVVGHRITRLRLLGRIPLREGESREQARPR